METRNTWDRWHGGLFFRLFNEGSGFLDTVVSQILQPIGWRMLKELSGRLETPWSSWVVKLVGWKRLVPATKRTFRINQERTEMRHDLFGSYGEYTQMLTEHYFRSFRHVINISFLLEKWTQSPTCGRTDSIKYAASDYSCSIPSPCHTELLSTHVKLNQYQTVIGNIIANQLQSSIRNNCAIQCWLGKNKAQGMQ